MNLRTPSFVRFINFQNIQIFPSTLIAGKLSFCAKRSEVAESIGEPMMDSATPDKDVLRAE
jgi:hypothetical protein